MAGNRAELLLRSLEEMKRRFGPGEGSRAEELLERIEGQRIVDAGRLIRLHECLLFLRAYPHNRAVLRQAGRMLRRFGERVEEARRLGADLEELEEPEVSGIAGTAVSAVLSYGVARWLVKSRAGEADIDWEHYDKAHHMGWALPGLVPLLEEDSLVEAHPPYRRWVGAASRGTGEGLAWLVKRLQALGAPLERQAELYDSLELLVRWQPGNTGLTRTHLRLPVRKIFYHKRPLLRRADVSLDAELQAGPLPVRQLAPEQGRKMVELARATSAMRYRELHGFTYGDGRDVLRVEAGRGVEIFFWGVPARHRLPLRAYHAAMFFKNGVPVGYVEGLSLAERTEVGFNAYYTFREGETAWLYARTLHLFRQLLGVTRFWLDPYQIGDDNEEAIDSGAFWFYRKLGFRPVQPWAVRLAENEERKIRQQPGYRTPARTLRRLSASPMIYEAPGVAKGEWDRFAVRNLGLAVQRRMAERHGGDSKRMRREAALAVERAIAVNTGRWKQREQKCFENLALVLGLIPDLASWTKAQKHSLARILRTKAGPDEGEYLRLMQRHERLRAALLELGSRD